MRRYEPDIGEFFISIVRNALVMSRGFNNQLITRFARSRVAECTKRISEGNWRM
jgi:hypothetical protein